ncbi:hypothetical protein COEREDRAFT_99740 [Coemansia reversa NRRL 1564]|uniref:Uncharacterized protein n=1 Tax=Coemansia reversa (strain ATCC 12441 / NRRL 1564) TaxID=763665 RepID=A0A2G5B2C9_COERN|nr:hypothetical protein COEREDRAFT_99740 [Coemansia reversa NRRL 1564]|eukprot:PIA13154.1 hypothetical protein COEREDRAFT_99740 [Coemansia reversa NRRL 1564]
MPRLLYLVFAVVTIIATAVGSSTSTDYKLGDEIKIECAQVESRQQDMEAKTKLPVWLSPHCIETDKSLVLYYGRDRPVQCSIKGESKFHRAMLRSIAFDSPLRCRLVRNKYNAPKYLEFPVKIEGVKARTSSKINQSGTSNAKIKRVNGNFNVVLHGHRGIILAAAMYPVTEQPLPETVSGITTMQFSQKWYEGGGLSVLMANKRSEEEFIIQPVVAIMFCILTACAVYVVGRVYVESTLIPRTLAEYGLDLQANAPTKSASGIKQSPFDEPKKTK